MSRRANPSVRCGLSGEGQREQVVKRKSPRWPQESEGPDVVVPVRKRATPRIGTAPEDAGESGHDALGELGDGLLRAQRSEEGTRVSSFQ